MLIHDHTAVLADVMRERERQDERWGEQNHDPALWLTILTEEVGELAQAILADRFGSAEHSSHSESIRAEAVQVAAVAIAMLECLDRHTAATSSAV